MKKQRLVSMAFLAATLCCVLSSCLFSQVETSRAAALLVAQNNCSLQMELAANYALRNALWTR